MSLETIAAFLLASCSISLAPGPDNIFVLTQSALYGRKSGLLVTLGLCTGLVVHTGAVVFGVAAIFQASPLAFSILKYLGAAYLLYLAWGVFTARPEGIASGHHAGLSRKSLYVRGIIMNVTNPKVSIFFLAFLPLFINTEGGSVTLQFLVLGTVFIGVTLVVFGLIASMAARLGQWFSRSPKVQIYLNRIAGTVFIGLAAKLLLSSA